MNASELEERIAQAERALVERDERVLWQTRALAGAVEQRLQRWRRPGLLGTAAGWLMAWWFPGLGRVGWRRVGSESDSGHTGRGLPWAVVLPLLWPLMPGRLRRRISFTRVAMIAGLTGPVLAWLRPARAAVETVETVDLARYAGRWYEVARLPALFEGGCLDDVTATYTPQGDGIEVDNRCRGRGGRERRAVGVAYPVEGSGDAKLEVSLFPRWLRWLPVAWTGYWIIDIDPDYQRAVVGTPGRWGLWLLSRTPVIDEAHYQAMVACAAGQGYQVARLKRVHHLGDGEAAVFASGLVP